MSTSLYQLYDGSVHLWGCRRAIWHGRGTRERVIIHQLLIHTLSSEVQFYCLIKYLSLCYCY